MSYPPPSPNAPPPGINPQFLPGDPSAPPGYSPATGYPPASGYPPATGYPPSSGYPPMEGYPPQGGGYPPQGGGYPPPQPMESYPPQGGGYPPPQPMESYPPQGGGYPPSYPQPGGYPPGPMINQPDPGMGYPQPGAMQPHAEGNWMPIPTGAPVCPPGLEYLVQIDQLLVHQKVEMLEAILGFETKNKYTVKNSLGQKVYTAKEDTDCCTRMCCGTARPFDMKIKDNAGNEVIHFYRELRCNSCLFPCCLQKLEVMSPPGTMIGTVEQEWSICTPQFVVKDASGTTILRIEGPFCTFSLCGDVEFQVLSTNGMKVGKITKQWSGLLREAFTDADHFGITFPIDLTVEAKATLLGALFLIDYMFFEKTGNKESDGIGML